MCASYCRCARYSSKRVGQTADFDGRSGTICASSPGTSPWDTRYVQLAMRERPAMAAVGVATAVLLAAGVVSAVTHGGSGPKTSLRAGVETTTSSSTSTTTTNVAQPVPAPTTTTARPASTGAGTTTRPTTAPSDARGIYVVNGDGSGKHLLTADQ